MSVVRVPSPNCPSNMSNRYKFRMSDPKNGTGDPRNGNCILWAGDQVETLDHYNWRINLPKDPSNQVAGPLMIVFGFMFGTPFAVTTFDCCTNKKVNGWITGLLALITLGFLVMFVSGIILSKNGNEKVEEEKEENKKYRNKEPIVMFERYNAI